MKTIMIHSYKGGTGKSVISSNIANILGEKGEKVLFIEMDYKGGELAFDEKIGRIFDQNMVQKKYLFDFFLEQDPYQIENYIVSGDPDLKFDFILCQPIFNFKEYKIKNNISSLSINQWYYHSIMKIKTGLDVIETKYDYLIIDTGPGYNRFSITILLLVNIVIICTRPNKSSIYSTIDFIKEFYEDEEISNMILYRKIETYIVVNQIVRMSGEQDQVFGKERMKKLSTRLDYLKQSRIRHNGIFEVEFDVDSNFMIQEEGIVLDNGLSVKDVLRKIIDQILD